MATSTLTRHYHCWDDCTPAGCPGHLAKLEYQSTSDALSFDDGKGHVLSGQLAEFEALVSMLYGLSTWRSEVSSMLERAISLCRQR